MEATISWAGPAATPSGSGMTFIATTGSGHTLAIDGAPADDGGNSGGRNLAPRPMEVFLAGAGGCTAYDVVLILLRGRHAVTRCDVVLKADRAETDPKVFTRIHFDFVVTGRSLKRDVVERAVKLSHDRYCSATAMLEKTAALSYAVEVREA